MKTAIRNILPLAALAAVAQAAPFLAIGDSAELFVTGTLGVRSDDNVLLSEKKVDDIIFTIAPGLDLVYGNGTLTKGHIIYKETMSQYSDNSKLDNELSLISADGVYDDQKTMIKFGTSFEQQAQSNVDVRPTATSIVDRNALIRRDVFNVGGSAEVNVTEKSSVLAGIAYDDTDYKRKGFTDLQATTLPVNYFYEMTPKVDLGFGFRFRKNDLEKGIDSKDYFYNISARGEFTPKVTGTVAVGYSQLKFNNGVDKGAFGLESKLDYAFDEKTSFYGSFSNAFGYSGTGSATRNSTATVGALSKIAADWTAGARVSYRDIKYFSSVGSTANDHTDGYFEGGLDATYALNAVVSFNGSYTFRNYDSTIKGGDFRNNVFSVSALIRY